MPRRLKHVKVDGASLHVTNVSNDGHGFGFLQWSFPERHWNSLHKHTVAAMKVMVAALDTKWPHPKFRASKVVSHQDVEP